MANLSLNNVSGDYKTTKGPKNEDLSKLIKYMKKSYSLLFRIAAER